MAMVTLPRMLAQAGRSGILRQVAAQGCRASAVRSAWALAAPRPSVRGFASTAASKVLKTLQAEIKHEEEQYEQAKEIKAFLKKTDFKLTEKPGDVNMVLEKDFADDKLVKIEWQLTSPFDPNAEGEGEEGYEQEATDFSVTVENKKTNAGITFYCSTQTGEDHRFVIGNVKVFANAEERDSVGAYNGPEFEDIDEKLQESFDELLAEVGMNNEVCDFIDASALDKEQQEYIRWLKSVKTFLES